jgi:hypothetical protein
LKSKSMWEGGKRETWRRTRAGLNWISTCLVAVFSRSKIFSTSFVTVSYYRFKKNP